MNSAMVHDPFVFPANREDASNRCMVVLTVLNPEPSTLVVPIHVSGSPAEHVLQSACVPKRRVLIHHGPSYVREPQNK